MGIRKHFEDRARRKQDARLASQKRADASAEAIRQREQERIVRVEKKHRESIVKTLWRPARQGDLFTPTEMEYSAKRDLQAALEAKGIEFEYYTLDRKKITGDISGQEYRLSIPHGKDTQKIADMLITATAWRETVEEHKNMLSPRGMEYNDVKNLEMALMLRGIQFKLRTLDNQEFTGDPTGKKYRLFIPHGENTRKLNNILHPRPRRIRYAHDLK